MSEAKAPTTTDNLPDELESPQTKLVYLYLLTAGASTLSELRTSLGIKKITLLSVLDALTDRSLVTRDGSEYRPVV